MKSIALYSGFFALFLLSCKKTDPVSPNQQIPTFQCNINLMEWYPTHMVVDFRGPIWAEFYAYDSQFALNILIDDSTNILTQHNFISDSSLAYVTNKQSGEEYSTFSYPTQNNGYLNITKIDSINKKLSGNFAFTAYNQEGFATVVKNGVLENVPFFE